MDIAQSPRALSLLRPTYTKWRGVRQNVKHVTLE